MTRGDLMPVDGFKIPRGRTAAERRLAAIAALHQPFLIDHGKVHSVDLGKELVCRECGGEYRERKWPCATARLLGEWPGEVPEP